MATQTNTPEQQDWRDTVEWHTEETWVSWTVHRVGTPLFMKLLAQVEVEGFEHVPQQGPCIIAGNHVSFFDVLYFSAQMAHMPHFMTKSDLFEHPLSAWYFRMMGTFPVYRNKIDLWAFRQAERVLAAQKFLFIFPEGTRSKDGKLRKGKAGATKLALELGVPVVPAAIIGTHEYNIWGARFSNRITMRYSEPLDLAAMAGPEPHSIKTLRTLSTALMERIAAMLPPEMRGHYA